MRIGRIQVSTEMVTKHHNEVIQIFQDIKFLPTFVDEDQKDILLLYIGISDNFRDLPDGEMIPLYLVESKLDNFSKYIFGVSEVPVTKITCG